MVNNLSDLNIHIDIATTRDDDLPAALNADQVLHFPRYLPEAWKPSPALWRWLRQHAGDYDLLHIHAVWSFASAAAARAAMAAGVPYILRPAGMLSAFSWQHKGWRKQLYWRLLEQKTVQSAAAIHVTSEAEGDDATAVAPGVPVHVIPNSIEDNAFDFLPVTGVDEDERPRLLFLGRLHPVKGIVDRLLPAIAAMQVDCQLDIVGDDDLHFPGYRAEVAQAIDDLQLQRRVNLVQGVSGDARWSWFDQADLFVLTSHSENFGIVIAEAMARGCPFVITPEVQTADFFAASGGGEVTDGSPGHLAALLDELIKDPARREKMSAAGRQFARQHFHGASVAQRIHTMYQAVMSDSEG